MSKHRPISVLLTTEGTYPFYTGGVSKWCDRLTYGLPGIDFRVLSIVTNPYPDAKYELAPNVKEVIKVPQWGLLEPAEFSTHQPTYVVLRNIWDTTPKVIATRFKPIFEQFLGLLFSSSCDKEELARVLLKLQKYFQRYDYQKTMNSVEVWDVLQHAVHASWECRPPEAENPTLAEVKQAYRLLYHLLMVLHFPIPDAQITHASAAGFCGLPCVFAKLVHGTPYLLTEHGVYVREQYLNLRRHMKSFFVRWFLYRLVENVVELNYHFADQVSPVCAFNARWEKQLGVPEDRIKVIFNGVDPERFHPYEREHNTRPLVSTVGLIYQLKGQLDLIRATGILKQRFDDLEIRFYGAPTDPKYFHDCKREIADLHLENNVTFAGSTKEPWRAYSNADVVAFPSISEGFPFAVLEAMLCGAAIVATDVGGVAEAVGDCGLLVPSKTPRAMADAITFLLSDTDARERLGRIARARALEHFTEKQFLDSYENTYRELVSNRTQKLVRT
jgi:glycosyltransferase involved in cell wall biosynthesis